MKHYSKKYKDTALDGGDQFRQKLTQELTSLDVKKCSFEAYYFNLKQAFPDEWYTFMNPEEDTDSQKLKFHISQEIIAPYIKKDQKDLHPELNEIIFKLDAPDVLSPLKFAKIKIGEYTIINESLVNNWLGDWVIDFDLTKVPERLLFLILQKISSIASIYFWRSYAPNLSQSKVTQGAIFSIYCVN